ncbi:MAG: hotdog fold domain-containing protein [Wenzhouxiangella sp.]
MADYSGNNYLLKLYHRVLGWPFGRAIFSRLFTSKAPYFATIKPSVVELKPNYCEVHFRKRKRVQNHIGTVHVIAICNGMEMAMGALAEASIPAHLRWIPRGMNVRYTAKADSDIRVIATANPDDWQPGDLTVAVKALRADDTVVVEGEIVLYVSEKPSKKAAA